MLSATLTKKKQAEIHFSLTFAAHQSKGRRRKVEMEATKRNEQIHVTTFAHYCFSVPLS
jgi:hypothetical protein